MRILVLGGNGFIGSHLVDKLRSEDHSVAVFDRRNELFRKPLSDVDYHYGEFGNRGLLSEALEKADLVYHLISTTLPKTSNDDPAFDIQSNVVETIFLLEKCVDKHVKRVVFISSGGVVYGRHHEYPLGEGSPTNPECSYGISKLTIEKYLDLFQRLYGLGYTIIRPSNPYGERQDPRGIQGTIPIFLGKVAKKEPIEVWGDGKIERDYIYIEDLVEGIYRASVLDTKSRIFNLGGGNAYSINDLIDLVRQVTSLPVSVTYTKGRTFDIPKVHLDIRRANSELSWAPRMPLKEGINRTWGFIKSLGSDYY